MEAETSYNISVYVTDSNGRMSSTYSVDITTESNLITFTITDTATLELNTYYAEPSMTFQQWINSDYNTSECQEYCPGDSVMAIIACNGRHSLDARSDDTIENNRAYTYDSSSSFGYVPCR